MAATGPVARFQEVFNLLDKDHLGLVAELYAPGIHFEDPIHEVKGLPALEQYFARLYEGVTSCRFEFHSAIESGDQAMLTWTMALVHGRFRAGELVRVPGASWIRHDGSKVTFHRDYFDVGALIYERIPVLGAAIRGIKKRL
jgi:hypothetical protein